MLRKSRGLVDQKRKQLEESSMAAEDVVYERQDGNRIKKMEASPFRLLDSNPRHENFSFKDMIEEDRSNVPEIRESTRVTHFK